MVMEQSEVRGVPSRDTPDLERGDGRYRCRRGALLGLGTAARQQTKSDKHQKTKEQGVQLLASNKNWCGWYYSTTVVVT